MPKRDCPTCGDRKKLTKHHIYPIRFFGNNDVIYWLCRSCHDQLELLIPDNTKLEKTEYVRILIGFAEIKVEGNYIDPELPLKIKRRYL